MVVSNIFLFTPLFGEDSHFDDHIFQMGWNSQLDYILYYTFLLKWFLVLGLGHGGEFLEGANFHGKFYIPGKLITWNPRVFRLGRWLFLFKQEIFRFQPLIFPGCMFHKFFPPKQGLQWEVGRSTKWSSTRRCRSNSVKWRNSDFFVNEDGRWDVSLLQKHLRQGGKPTMNYLDTCFGRSKRANIEVDFEGIPL